MLLKDFSPPKWAKHFPDWTLHADTIEVEIDGKKLDNQLTDGEA
jgi:hypothetical protein